MQYRWLRLSAKSVLGAGLLLAVLGRTAAWGDDTGLLGRIFRFGGNPASSNTAPPPGGQPAPLPYGGGAGTFLPPGGSAASAPAPLSNYGGLPESPPIASSNGPGQRITPKSRVSSAVTSADPILTRMALGRSNDGSQFGMFMQVFADGTVIDSEGVHHVRMADLKPIIDVVQSGELGRVHGHCGAPATDFIEYVHIVAYERRFGRLMANSFSYSGNAQGCDHVIKHIHTALETLQSKLGRQAVIESPGAASVPGAMNPVPTSGYGTTSAVPYGTSSARQPTTPGMVLPPGIPSGPAIPLSSPASSR
ncbi:MAG: hypothetical protein ACLQGP_31255 [Isosphaeraceae bacterium]